MNKLPLQNIYSQINSYNCNQFIATTTKQRQLNPSLELSKLKDIEFDVDKFFQLDELPNLFSININDWKYSFLFIKKNYNSRLYIVFSGSRKTLEKCVFRRHSWNYFFNGSVIYISDPMFYKYDDLTLGWYIGDNFHNINKNLIIVIKHIIKIYGFTDIITYGSSGGGFAALKFSQYFICKSIVINPQISPISYEYFNEFSKITGIEYNDLFRDRLDFVINNNSKYLLLQNETSKLDLNTQLFPFLKKYDIYPKYGLTKFNNINIWIYHAFGGHNAQEDLNIFPIINYIAEKLFSNELDLISYNELDNMVCALSNVWADICYLRYKNEKLNKRVK